MLNCEFVSSDKDLVSLAGVSAPVFRIVGDFDLNHEEMTSAHGRKRLKKQLLSWSNIYWQNFTAL